jgi:hypothetical protein
LIGDALFEPIVGQTYTVVWDGVTYADIVCIDDDGYLTIGDPYGDFSTIPFYMQYVSGLFGIFTNSTASSHSIKITTIQSEIIKIDKKYLPVLVGQDVEGTVFNINGDNWVADAGAEIFNNYASNIAVGYNSHAEGYETTATGEAAHAEGGSTQAFGYYSHAEG